MCIAPMYSIFARTDQIRGGLDNIYEFKIKTMKEIILKIDSDNDIYQMSVNGEVYTLDNVYESKYGKLFDELNMSIEVL